MVTRAGAIEIAPTRSSQSLASRKPASSSEIFKHPANIMSTVSSKHQITHEKTGTADVRLNSMKADGPLEVAAVHFFAVKLGRTPATAGGMVR